MVIYLDLVFISTIVVNTLIIEAVECFFNEKINIIRVLICDILSCLLLTLFILPIGKLIFIRYFMGILLGVIAFNKCSITKRIIKITLYYLLNLSLIGTLAIFKINNLFFLMLCTLFIVIISIIISYQNNNELIVSINNKTLIALHDTGNSCYYENIPICYLDKKFKTKDYSFYKEIEINTISGPTLIYIYIGPNIYINKKKYNVFYAFSNISNYDIVLHKDIGGLKCLNY